MCYFIATLILFCATAVRLGAQTSVFPQLAPRAAVATLAAMAAQPGQALAINLGWGEILKFIWIGPLKIWVGQFEVTNGQYRRFDLGHESKSYYGHLFNEPEQPVVWVSWEDANNYCVWLTRTFHRQIPVNYHFRLPQEKEWQSFAACGEAREYPWGNPRYAGAGYPSSAGGYAEASGGASAWPPPNTFNYRGEEGVRLLYRLFQRENYIRGHKDEFVVTCPVKHSGANAWGLFGVGGNVWEWCQDWFDQEQITRSLRGASWNNDEPDIIAITNRSDAYPERRNSMIGFRVVIAPLNR
ncbi:MAG: SUMF1/EgtB/PvdO family nonheme iron enzyme [Lentisphaerae bacterium]|nr:SUMF1/EgtB/PvdO family nonheme iron enzyme [Lentisphaerota bacterium]